MLKYAPSTYNTQPAQQPDSWGERKQSSRIWKGVEGQRQKVFSTSKEHAPKPCTAHSEEVPMMQ